jgi:hypothetical protein
VIVCRPSAFPSWIYGLGEFVQNYVTDNKAFSSFQAQSERIDRQYGDFFGAVSACHHLPSAAEHVPWAL